MCSKWGKLVWCGAVDEAVRLGGALHNSPVCDVGLGVLEVVVDPDLENRIDIL